MGSGRSNKHGWHPDRPGPRGEASGANLTSGTHVEDEEAAGRAADLVRRAAIRIRQGKYDDAGEHLNECIGVLEAAFDIMPLDSTGIPPYEHEGYLSDEVSVGLRDRLLRVEAEIRSAMGGTRGAGVRAIDYFEDALADVSEAFAPADDG